MHGQDRFLDEALPAATAADHETGHVLTDDAVFARRKISGIVFLAGCLKARVDVPSMITKHADRGNVTGIPSL